MRIKIQQFLGQNAHSWSIVGRSIGRELIKLGHNVEFISTNGLDGFPEDLKPWLRAEPTGNYDLQFSFTAPKNFPLYLAHGKSNRMGLWSSETSPIAPGFAKFYKNTDKFLTYSKFAKDIFIKNNIPENHIHLIPLGYNEEDFLCKDKYPLKTNKSFKILSVIAQPHLRKAIPDLFESYGKAFTKNDDVCLVCKVVIKKTTDNTFQVVKNVSGARNIRKQNKKIEEKNKNNKIEQSHQFEVDFNKIYSNFCKKFPNHAEVEIISDYVENMATLYNATNVTLSTTMTECLWLPGIEAMAANNIPVASNYGGQLDYMNENNSLLIEGKIVRAPKELQYWVSSPYAEVFKVDTDDAADKLFFAYKNYNTLLEKFKPGMKEVAEKFTWENAAKKLLSLCE
jgi:glycosyltransferase involved in cell wall biosynthesis